MQKTAFRNLFGFNVLYVLFDLSAEAFMCVQKTLLRAVVSELERSPYIDLSASKIVRYGILLVCHVGYPII